MMKNYIQQIIELFGHNEYSLATRRKCSDGWLTTIMRKKKKKHFTRCGNKRETESTSRNATVHITDATKSGNAVCRFR